MDFTVLIKRLYYNFTDKNTENSCKIISTAQYWFLNEFFWGFFTPHDFDMMNIDLTVPL